MEPFYRQLGRLLRDRRRKLGLTQEQLSARVGLKRPTITNIERGRQGLTVDQLVQLASALECSPVDLIPAESSGEPLIDPQLKRELQRKGAGAVEKEFVARVARRVQEEEPNGG